MNNLYGNYRTRKFTDIYEEVDAFKNDYNNCGIPTTISEASVETLFYLLYARYGNSHIASSDENQFKYKIFSLIFVEGLAWQKKLEIQQSIAQMDLDAIKKGSKQVYNHSYNPGTEPSTDELNILPTVNDQNVTLYERSDLDAYSYVLGLLDTDVTSSFLNRFKNLFLTVVEPQRPLWYETEIDITEDNE